MNNPAERSEARQTGEVEVDLSSFSLRVSELWSIRNIYVSEREA